MDNTTDTVTDTQTQAQFVPKNTQVKRILAALAQCGDVDLSEREQRAISSRHGEVVKRSQLEERAELSFGKTMTKDGQRKYSASGKELLTRDCFTADLCVWEQSLRDMAKQCNGGTLTTDWLESFGLVPTPKTFRAWLVEFRDPKGIVG